MATSGAVTGSAALTELKKDLTQLSATLHEIFELMNMDMRNIGDAWQDGKYQEFVDGYRPQINKCEEISERYKEWCLRVLEPTIENVIAVEKTDVGGDGSGSVGGTFGGGSAAGIGGSAAMASAASKIGSVGRLGRRAAMGSRRPTTSNAQPVRSATGRLATSTDNPTNRTTSARSAAKPTTSASSNAARSATKTSTNTAGNLKEGVTPADMGGSSLIAQGKDVKKGDFDSWVKENIPPKETIKPVPISNGCGPESSWGVRFLANNVGRPIDAAITGTDIETQNTSCDQHDVDRFNGDPQSDDKFCDRSPFMCAMVKGDTDTAAALFKEGVNIEIPKPFKVAKNLILPTPLRLADELTNERVSKGIIANVGAKIIKGFDKEGISQTNETSLAQSEIDRESSKQLEQNWEELHQQNYYNEDGKMMFIKKK